MSEKTKIQCLEGDERTIPSSHKSHREMVMIHDPRSRVGVSQRIDINVVAAVRESERKCVRVPL
jgi:hypothetical protein